MAIRGIIRRLRFARSAEQDRVRLFQLGSVGKNVRLTGWVNFGSEPFLVHLGSNITIAEGVAFVTHDGGVRVLRDKHPDLHVYAPITVSDDVFIGLGAVILPGVRIGARSVIGAGSVVTRDVPSGTVNAGVPCRVIRSIDEYETACVEKGFTWPVGEYDARWASAVAASVRRLE
ncbi:acyltransferase [Rhodococcus opacus]|uniref:acyltransferase n=1 Tax=Rhodococcus opacus TaxID=37919 RepID=UPI001B30BB75|nr:DapH/DapD/GlmU-related protein [Rhodococcus opacus]